MYKRQVYVRLLQLGDPGGHARRALQALDTTFGVTLGRTTVSYTHLRAHETVLDLVCRLLLEKKNKSLKCIDIDSRLLLKLRI